MAIATLRIDNARGWIPGPRVRGGVVEFKAWYEVDSADMFMAINATGLPQKGDAHPNSALHRALDIEPVLIAAERSFWEVTWRFDVAGATPTPEDVAEPGDAYTKFGGQNAQVQVDADINGNKLPAPDTIETPQGEIEIHLFSDGTDISDILTAVLGIVGTVNEDNITTPPLWTTPTTFSISPGQLLARFPEFNVVREGIIEVIIPFGVGQSGAWKSRQRREDQYGNRTGPVIVQDKYTLAPFAPVMALWTPVGP